MQRVRIEATGSTPLAEIMKRLRDFLLTRAYQAERGGPRAGDLGIPPSGFARGGSGHKGGFYLVGTEDAVELHWQGLDEWKWIIDKALSGLQFSLGEPEQSPHRIFNLPNPEYLKQKGWTQDGDEWIKEGLDNPDQASALAGEPMDLATAWRAQMMLENGWDGTRRPTAKLEKDL